MQRPQPSRLQKQALPDWNPGAGLRWPLQRRTACRGGKETGQLLIALETSSPPSPASAQGKQIFEFTQAGAGWERWWVGCLHVHAVQGKGAWWVVPGNPKELTLISAPQRVF